jgi:hypothetical protein
MENNSFVLEVINLTNQHRTQMGLSALSVDIDLKEAAQYHSGNMAALDFFAHQDLDNKSPADRAEDFGYETRYVGENIASGQTTPRRYLTLGSIAVGTGPILKMPTITKLALAITLWRMTQEPTHLDIIGLRNLAEVR